MQQVNLIQDVMTRQHGLISRKTLNIILKKVSSEKIQYEFCFEGICLHSY